MKHNYLKHLFTALLLLCTTIASAYDFEVGGIYYNILSEEDKTVEVINGTNRYTGDVVIPGSVTYNGDIYSVTSIGFQTFFRCTGLKSVLIGNGVKCIGQEAFAFCSDLKNITIPNSVTSIGYAAFGLCTSLTSLVIPNSVTNIGESAFNGCSGLTSIEIPNSVTSIGNYAFYYCSNLESVTIGNSVTSIGSYAFYGCYGLTSVHLLGETPPTVGSNNFTNKQYVNMIVYVPKGTLATYQAANTWKNFWDIREEDTTETPEEEVKKCATPLITYNNSGLDIASETDGSEIHTDITCSDANSYNGDRIDLSATYSITTYATKSGYLNSDTATATLCWIAVSGSSEENSIIEVEAMPVLITCNNGTINICGGKEGAEVVVYTTSGVAVGNATITNGNASISTELAMGEIVVVNIAGKGIKIVMQ